MPKPAGRGFESVKITEHVCFGHGSLTTDANNDSMFQTVSDQTGLCVASELYSAGLISVQHSETVHMKNKWLNVKSQTHLNTVVADRTVGAAWRPVEAAGWTPLHPDLDPSDLHRLVQRSTEIVFFVLVLLGCTENTHNPKTDHLLRHEVKSEAVKVPKLAAVHSVHLSLTVGIHVQMMDYKEGFSLQKRFTLS